jgi:adenylylsulfate kinase
MNFCLWLTGLPGSGKSTIVKELEHILSDQGIEIIVLNLDLIRKTITPEPKYTDEERHFVYRSLVLMAQLLVDKGGKNVIIDATGNRLEFRDLARELIPEFAEIYVKCPLETSQARERSRNAQWVQNNLYHKAKTEQLKGHLPGISAPYEEPESPELLIASDLLSPQESARKIAGYIKSRWGR